MDEGSELEEIYAVCDECVDLGQRLGAGEWKGRGFLCEAGWCSTVHSNSTPLPAWRARRASVLCCMWAGSGAGQPTLGVLAWGGRILGSANCPPAQHTAPCALLPPVAVGREMERVRGLLQVMAAEYPPTEEVSGGQHDRFRTGQISPFRPAKLPWLPRATAQPAQTAARLAVHGPHQQTAFGLITAPIN